MTHDKSPDSSNQEVLISDVRDIAEHKIFAALAYIGILFLVPLIAAKSSPFARFHTNQGFVLFLGWIVVGVVGWFPILGWLVGVFGSIFLIVLSIMGIINALTGKMKDLPLIGHIRIYT